jgi:hypothetical protein
MKWQFVVTHTIQQTEIPVSQDSWVANTPSVKVLCPRNNCLSLYFRKNVTCVSLGLLNICQFFSVSCKTVLVGYSKLLYRERCMETGLGGSEEILN